MSLSLHDVSFAKSGATFSLSVEVGHSLCVVGLAASGRSQLLRMIAGIEPPARGSIERPKLVAIPEPCNRRLRPQDLSHKKGANKALLATEVLSHLGLWDVRQKVVSELAPPQVTACDLVEVFMSGAELIVLDGQLDLLDPWVRVEALRLLRERCARGAIGVVATNNLDMATQFDYLVVLKAGLPLYVGSVAELLRGRSQRSLVVESERSIGVRALVDPLLVDVAKTEGGYKLTPGPGQEHSARLLRDGYGDVRFIVSDEKSVTEVILGLVS